MRNDGLDQYPILWRARSIPNTLNLPQNFSEALKIFYIAVQLPVPWHSWGYPILPDSRNCLFLVHTKTAALTFVLSPIFGNSFVHISSAHLIILFESLKDLSQHPWWQLHVLADVHDSNWTHLVRYWNHYSQLFSLFLFGIMRIIRNNYVSLFTTILIIPKNKNN